MTNDQIKNVPTSKLVSNWFAAREHMNSLKKQLEEQRKRLAYDEAELAKRLLPRDAKLSERVGIWIRLANDQEILLWASRISDKPEYMVGESFPSPV